MKYPVLIWSDQECSCQSLGLQRSIDVDVLQYKLKESRPQPLPWGECSVIKVLNRKVCWSSGLSVQKRQHKPLLGETHKAWWSQWLKHDTVVENGLFPYTKEEFIRSVFVSYTLLFCTCILFFKPITQHSMISPSSYPPSPRLRAQILFLFSCQFSGNISYSLDRHSFPVLFFLLRKTDSEVSKRIHKCQSNTVLQRAQKSEAFGFYALFEFADVMVLVWL